MNPLGKNAASFRRPPNAPDNPSEPATQLGTGQPIAFGREANGAVYPAGNWPTAPTRVYAFSRAWNAVDVYVQCDGAATGQVLRGGVLSVLVYAVTQVGQIQTSTLVASGRLADPFVPALGPPISIPIAQERGVAQRYEVYVYFNQAAALQPTNDLRVTCVGSDDADAIAVPLGVVPFSILGPNTVGASAAVNLIAPFVPNPKLVGVRAACDQTVAASGRYLQLFDQHLAIVNGTVPLLEWAIGDNAGDGIVDMNVNYRALIGIGLRASSTSGVLTNVADCNMSAIIQ